MVYKGVFQYIFLAFRPNCVVTLHSILAICSIHIFCKRVIPRNSIICLCFSWFNCLNVITWNSVIRSTFGRHLQLDILDFVLDWASRVVCKCVLVDDRRRTSHKLCDWHFYNSSHQFHNSLTVCHGIAIPGPSRVGISPNIYATLGRIVSYFQHFANL